MVLSTACKKAVVAPQAESPVIAVVNQESVRRDAFETFMAVRIGNFKDNPPSAKVLSGLLDEFISRQVILQEAGRRGITSDPTPKPDDFTQPAPASNDSTVGGLLRDRERRTDETVRTFQRMLAMSVTQPSREDVTRHYEEHRDRYERRGYYVREIRLESPTVIAELARKLAADPKSFAELARKHSHGPNAGQGGLNYYERGQLPPQIEERVLALRPGEIGPVLKTDYGFHIFKFERNAEPLSFDSVREEIMDEIIAARQQERIEAETERLVSSASVEFRKPALGFEYVGRFQPSN